MIQNFPDPIIQKANRKAEFLEIRNAGFRKIIKVSRLIECKQKFRKINKMLKQMRVQNNSKMSEH